MKPSDLLLGLRELFGFVVPGALFLACLPVWVVGWVGDTFPLSGNGWIDGEGLRTLLFLSGAYAIGSVLSGVGSKLDDWADAEVRASASQQEMVDDASHSRITGMAALADELRSHALDRLPVSCDKGLWGKRGFWWNYLRVHCPQGVMEIDRLEAQQKLFRSLIAGASILALLEGVGLAGLSDGGSVARLAIFVLAAVHCFFSYRNLRGKLTERLHQLAVIQFVGDDLHLARAPAATR